MPPASPGTQWRSGAEGEGKSGLCLGKAQALPSCTNLDSGRHGFGAPGAEESALRGR